MTNADSTITNDLSQTNTNYLTVDDIAYTLQIHNETVRRLLKNGRIKAIKIPGRGQWRISPTDFQKFLDSLEGNK